MTKADSSNPNIVVIMSDMHRGDCISGEGRNVKTPHIEALAKNGVRFRNAVAPNPVCMPARASVLTGLLPRTHGVHDNGINLQSGVADRFGFASNLNRAGRNVAFVGKAHFRHSMTGSEVPPRDRRTVDGAPWFGPYMGFDHVELIAHYHHNQEMPIPENRLHYEEWLCRDGQKDEILELWDERLAPDCGFNQVWHSALPVQYHSSTWCGDRTIEYLKRSARQNSPFVLWVSFPDPHTPYDAPEPWSRMYDPEAVDLPRHRSRDFDGRPWWHKASRDREPEEKDPVMHDLRVNWSRPGQLEDDVLRQVTANYYAMISLIDHNVGRIVECLRDLGLHENTVVVFVSDHGEWLGDHGLLLKGPMLYEGLMRVPLIMSGPNIVSGLQVTQPVSTMDLCATIFDLSGVASNEGLDSVSLTPFLQGDVDASRDFAYSEWLLGAERCGVALDLSYVRSAQHKLTYDAISEVGELYDLQEDPHEMHDVWGNPSYRRVQRELLDMMRFTQENRQSPARTEV